MRKSAADKAADQKKLHPVSLIPDQQSHEGILVEEHINDLMRNSQSLK